MNLHLFHLEDLQQQWDEFAESSSANARDLEVQQSRVEYTEQLLSRLGRRAIELDTLSKQQLVEDDQGVAEIADEIVTLEESLRSLDRSVDQIITESRLDSLSILNAVKRFSDERDKRLELIKKDIPNY